MAIKGSPRDMKKWLELLLDPNIQFPGESGEYRRARNELLESERELRRMNQQVAAERRALPLGGVLQGDYVFESAADDSQVRFSELFAPGKDTLVTRPTSGRPGRRNGPAAAGRAAVPVLHIDRRRTRGRCFPLAARINLAVVAKTSPDRLGTYAQERGWHNIRLLSSRNNTFNRDYHGETPEGEQLPVLNVFSRDEDGIRHRWASELTFAPGGDTSSLDPIWPIWGALDMTPEGRGDGAGYPSLQYE